MTTDPNLFPSQLAAALAVESPDPIEVAILGGLVARSAEADQALVERARAFLDASETIDQALVDLPIEEVARQLVCDADARADQFHYLLELDELCAACWFADCRERAVPTISLVASFIHSEPDEWKWLAGTASTMLSRIGREPPPHREDPAYRLWAAIEAVIM
jgi:hypothetical protein